MRTEELEQLKLTPTERRLFDATADNQVHSIGELLLVIDEEGMATYANLQVHMCNLRKKLSTVYQDIVFQSLNRYESGYRRVALLEVRIN